MTKKELMIKAHKMTKEIKTQYPSVDYKFQLGLCLAYLQQNKEVTMVELQGSEKQVKWANDIREVIVNRVINSNVECKEELLNRLTVVAKDAIYFINLREKFLDNDLELEVIFKNAIKKYKERKGIK